MSLGRDPPGRAVTRADRATRRREWFETRIGAADTPRRRLAVACDWLVSEAWRAGPGVVDAAVDLVTARIHEIREGQQ
jgi:hypothetical protein